MFGSRKRVKPKQLERMYDLNPLLASGRPVLVDFYQYGCRSCQIMDGVINELADEYAESAHVVKVNVTKVPGAAQMFGVRSTPTFVLLGGSPKKAKKKGQQPRSARTRIAPRWRGAGLVKKDFLARVLESNGAARSN